MYNPQLETFLCVAECGSFNKAAEKLFISPPAVIKQINLLEENLDLQLFVRTHRGLQLTEAGKSLAQDAKYIIQYCKDSVTRAKNVMKKSEDIIRIGTSSMTPAQVLVDLWPKLQEECPGVKFQLVPFDNTPENAREILANLGQNIDVIAGIFDETMLNLRRCAGLEISKEPICAAVSIHHRLAGKLQHGGDLARPGSADGPFLPRSRRGPSPRAPHRRRPLEGRQPCPLRRAEGLARRRSKLWTLTFTM